MRLLNIGAGAKGIPAPPWYVDWEIVRLDIEPQAEPDLLMDAMDLETLDAAQFHAVYGSHLLEHIYPFDLPRFLSGVRHVLMPAGFAEFRVPNALGACRQAAEHGLSALCYESAGGPVTAWDMLYGYEQYQINHGAPMAHHNGFDTERLWSTLYHYGFPKVYVQATKWELRAIACLTDLPDSMKKSIHLD